MAKGNKKSEPLNRWIALIFAVITILLGTLFTSEVFFNKPILREEAAEVSGVFKDFNGYEKLKGGFSEVSLFFVDAPRQYIDSCCVSEELLDFFFVLKVCGDSVCFISTELFLKCDASVRNALVNSVYFCISVFFDKALVGELFVYKLLADK